MIGALHYHYLCPCYGHHLGINNCTGAYGLELYRHQGYGVVTSSCLFLSHNIEPLLFSQYMIALQLTNDKEYSVRYTVIMKVTLAKANQHNKQLMITSHPPLFCCTCEWETSNSYTNDGLIVYVVIYVDSKGRDRCALLIMYK